MNLFFILGCFLLIALSYGQTIKYVKCGKGKQILNIRNFTMSPDPIKLSENETKVWFDGDLVEDIPTGARIQIKVWKVKKFIYDIYIPAPCLLSIGCDVEHCKFFEYFSDKPACPVKSQSFHGDAIEIKMPELDSFVKWFASGRFFIQLKITGPNAEQLSCYSIEGEAKALFLPNVLPEKEENEI